MKPGKGSYKGGHGPYPDHVLKRVDRPTTIIKKCARECPAQAISHGDRVMFNNYEKWPNDVRKCISMRIGNQHGAGCGRCIKVCPWNKPFTPSHRAMGWSMPKVSPVRRFAVWGDDLLGYGKESPEDKWWLDLEEEGGELVVPKR